MDKKAKAKGKQVSNANSEKSEAVNKTEKHNKN